MPRNAPHKIRDCSKVNLRSVPFEKEVKIAVIGAGAIGGIIAGFIKRAGYDVEVACKHQGLAGKISSGQLHIFGKMGDFRIAIPAKAKISELSGPKDIVFLAVKAQDVPDAARELLPLLSDKSIVISMQNGMSTDTIIDLLGPARTVGCVMDWGATMHSPGELEMTAKGGFAIGYIDIKPDERLHLLKQVLGTVLPVEITCNIRGKKYYKLMVNSCINSMGVISGLKLGKMFSIRKIRTIFSEITREAMAVANAMGLRPEPISGKLDYYKWLHGAGVFDDLKLQLLSHIIEVMYRTLKSSSLQSFERGKPTEIDYLNAYIADKGKKHNIPTPVNNKIVEIVKDIEAGRRRVTLDNLNDRFFARFEQHKPQLT